MKHASSAIPYVVYALCDETGVRYIGASRNVRRRYWAHLSAGRRHAASMREWLASLRHSGKAPDLVILEEGVAAGAREVTQRERHYISVYSVAIGSQLLNTYDRSDFLPIQAFEWNARKTRERLRHESYRAWRSTAPRYSSRFDVIEFNGQSMTIEEWAAAIGIKPESLLCRLRQKRIDEALTMRAGACAYSRMGDRAYRTRSARRLDKQ